MSDRIGLLLRLRGCDGELFITIETLDGRRLSIDDTSVTLMLWREEPDVVRLRLEHPPTHQIAYLQGSAWLDSLASALHLTVAPNTR
jgi:hypothetical protein